MRVPVDQILPIFFAAMQQGYAANALKGSIPELPASRAIYFYQGSFEVVDCYVSNPFSGYSFGTTTIYYHGSPVWVMQYHGMYPDHVIPFLKGALQAAYEKETFVGGRGPIVYGNGNGLRYTNIVKGGSTDRHNFSGREEIWQGGRLEGWYEYRGLLLV